MEASIARILVIDDEVEFRALARRILEAEGHEVIEAGTGDEGIAQCEAHQPDIIVTDIFMPEKSGIETILQIRQTNAAVRIIAVSGAGGLASGDLLASAARAGADRTLEKPFRARQFVEAIEDAASAPTKRS
jgi:CheY-like chemotaxis protein